MDLPLKAMSIVLGPMFTLFLGLLVTRPRVGIRVATFMGSVALGALFSTVLTLYGIQLTIHAINKHPDTSSALASQVAATTDGKIEQTLTFALVSGTALALCLAAVWVSKMVLDDKARDEADAQAARKTEE